MRQFLDVKAYEMHPKSGFLGEFGLTCAKLLVEEMVCGPSQLRLTYNNIVTAAFAGPCWC